MAEAPPPSQTDAAEQGREERDAREQPPAAKPQSDALRELIAGLREVQCTAADCVGCAFHCEDINEEEPSNEEDRKAEIEQQARRLRSLSAALLGQ
jgi:hypothetical protein